MERVDLEGKSECPGMALDSEQVLNMRPIGSWDRSPRGQCGADRAADEARSSRGTALLFLECVPQLR